MLRSLSLQQFRGLREFTMSGLGRVNLLVGANNCGKTSVLEALHMLLSPEDPWALWSALSRRGEEAHTSRRSPYEREMDVSHLFEGHEIELDSAFRVTGTNDAEGVTLDARIIPASATKSYTERPLTEKDLVEPGPERPGTLAIKLQWNGDATVTIPLTRAGGLALDVFPSRLPRRKRAMPEARSVEFITTGALDAQTTVSHLEDVVLTPSEDILLRALRSIEPGIERIAPLGSRFHEGGRGGIAVKLAGAKRRIPLGSMGDGMWRMLGIALSVVRAAGGFLLIDEIDTGLHYTVMEDMWRLVHDAARRLDVQVFAATHSRDCTQSLAAIVHAGGEPRPEVTIQRIERDNPRAVAFTDDEIRVAAEIGAEVR